MKKDLSAILILVAFTTAILFFTFKPILQHPNNYLLSESTNAVKSYYNFSYFLKYDKGIIHDGINYPYGEHLQYTNSQPFQLAILKQVNKIIPISNYGVAIINLSMILSILLALPFLFLILRHYKLPVWYSVVMTLLILFLSPQLGRIKGHFEMVYLFFIPVFWYLLILFRKGKKPWLWGGLLMLSGLIGGYTSAYYAAFYATFLLSVLLSDIIRNWAMFKQNYKQWLILFALSIIPLLLVNGLVSVTDQAGVRPENPLGFFVFHATKFSIFLPNSVEFRELIKNVFNINYQWEGRSYVGLPATLLALSMIYAFVHNLVTKKKNISLYIDQDLNTYLLGAIFILLFSMCFPFKLISWPVKIEFEFLLDLWPQLRQFRALGRFSWIFYYVFTVYTANFFYNLFLKMRAKGFVKFPVLFLSFVILFWTIDTAINFNNSFKEIKFPNNMLEANSESYQEIIEEANIKITDYQAIFFLPYTNTSGDKFLFEDGYNAFDEAMNWSYHTGLPLIQSYEQHIPVASILSSVQMLADSTIRKTRLDDMNEKPILLIYTNEKMTTSETWLKNRSKTLWKNNKVTLGRVDLDLFISSHQNWLNYANSMKKRLTGSDSIKSSVRLSRIYYNDFELYESKNVLGGKGAIFEKKKTIQLFNETFSEMGITGNYELSFWMLFDTRMYDMPKPILYVYNSEGLLLNTIELNSRAIHNIYKSWVRIEQSISIEHGMSYILEVTGPYVTIDELLLQPRGSNVLITKSNGIELFNNFPLSKD